MKTGKANIILLLALIFSSISFAQSAFDFEEVFKQMPKSLRKVAQQPDKYRIQILYTQINRDQNNKPTFTQYNYSVDEKKYFYSASLVKLPTAALALERANELKIPRTTSMFTDSGYYCQKKIHVDKTTENKFPSLENYIKKMMLVSDDEAYNRVYEFIPRDYIHEKLAQKGYPKMRVTGRFDFDCTAKGNSCTNPISFYNMENNKLIYQQSMACSNLELNNPIGKITVGKAFQTNDKKLVKRPKDFTGMNFMPMQDITEILKSIIFPNAVAPSKKFNLTESDYIFLRQYMSMYPRESKFPKYSEKDYKDSYKKYFIYGDKNTRIESDSVNIYNVVGQAYGFLSDVAYITDTKNNVEFMLSAVIYVNKDEVLNDGVYEYETIGFPFLAELGRQIYSFERTRKK